MAVVSEPGVGTTITFVLNFQVDSTLIGTVPSRSVESSVSLAGKRILLVEDDPVSAMAEIAMLQKQGIVVTLSIQELLRVIQDVLSMFVGGHSGDGTE